jgi:hypothetical protein
VATHEGGRKSQSAIIYRHTKYEAARQWPGSLRAVVMFLSMARSLASLHLRLSV